MKLMIASDIHGSAFYCKKMVEAFEKEGADRLLLLGDLLYHGPRNDLPKEYQPKEVIAMLNELKNDVFCVRGNCEAEVDRLRLPRYGKLCRHSLFSKCYLCNAWPRVQRKKSSALEEGGYPA